MPSMPRPPLLRGTSTLRADLVAGLTSALVYIPQGMAYALVAGVSPAHGLYTGIVAPLVGALTAGSTFMVVIGTNELAMAMGSVAAEVGGFTVGALVTLTLLVGCFQLVLGLLRLGSLTRFISESVMTGFVTGVAVLLVLGQLHGLTGARVGVTGNAVVRTWDWLTHPGRIDAPTTAVGLLTIGAILLFQRTRLRPVAFLLGLAAASVAAALLAAPSVKLVGAIAEIPRSLPAPALPDLAAVPRLLLPALSLAILGVTVAAGVAQSYPEPDGSIPDASRDFVGQGAANVATSFFQGIPAGGSLSRTATSVGAGARTRLANVLLGVILAAALLTVGGLAARFPLAALAGLLIVIGAQALRPARIARVRHTYAAERVAMGLTFLLTLTIPLQYAILAGVLVTLALYVYSSSTQIRIVELAPLPDGRWEERPAPTSLPAGRATVLHVVGNSFFAGVYKLERSLPAPPDQGRAAVILSLRGRDLAASTGLAFAERYAKKFRAGGHRLFFCGVGPGIVRELEGGGTLDALGRDSVFPATAILGESAAQARAAAERWLEASS